MTDNSHIAIRKNQREELRVGLSEFHGIDLINLRVWYSSQDGSYRPGRDGIALRIEQLPELIQALRQAEDSARGQGLLPTDKVSGLGEGAP